MDEVVELLAPKEDKSDDSDSITTASVDKDCEGNLRTGDQSSGGAPKEKKITMRVNTEDKFFCEYYHEMMISPVYILRALREFVTNYYEEKEGLPTTAERLLKKRDTLSRMMTESDIERYWERFKLIYDEDRIRTWDALLGGLRKYHEILKDRKNLCDEVVELRKQNQDLKRLLANYIDHEGIMPPPCPVDNAKFGDHGAPKYNRAKKVMKKVAIEFPS